MSESSSRPVVFVSRIIPEAGLKLIRQHCDAEVWSDQLPPSAEVLRDKARDCDGLVTLLTDRVDAELIKSCPNLRVISNFAVGVNNIDLAAATERGIPVGNTPGALTDATADTAVTLLLTAARRIIESAADARAGRWKTWEPCGWIGHELKGKTVGIVGMGRIGFATAARLYHGWGMKVLYTARQPKPQAEVQLGAQHVSLEDLLAESDFVSLHADLNASTQGLFGATQFAQMKSSAVFVNTSRGGLVDQSALATALREGTIFAAGLDVTDPEPLPSDHELFSLSNCVIVPHIGSATVAARDAMARICAENLLAGLRGEPLPHCVNPEVSEKHGS